MTRSSFVLFIVGAIAIYVIGLLGAYVLIIGGRL